jgi:serine/threonine protein kinase
VLLDFGLSCHAHYPDLLAEELRKAVGSPAWMAPEQVVGVRGDLRSDIFAIGVMLYELATGELPFGAPTTTAACASACGWRPRRRAHRPDLPWLQEIILRCLEPEAAQRYPRPRTWPSTCAPRAGALTERGSACGLSLRAQALGARRGHALPAQPAAQRQIEEAPSSWWPCRTRT